MAQNSECDRTSVSRTVALAGGLSFEFMGGLDPLSRGLHVVRPDPQFYLLFSEYLPHLEPV